MSDLRNLIFGNGPQDSRNKNERKGNERKGKTTPCGQPPNHLKCHFCPGPITLECEPYQDLCRRG